MRKKQSAEKVAKRPDKSTSVKLDTGPLATSIGFALRMASFATTQRFHEAMRAFDLRPAQFGTLVLIAANPGVRQRDLSEALRIEKANFAGLLDNLERRNLVERRSEPEDRRRYAIHLTRDGQGLLRRACRAHDRMEAGFQKLLPARATKQFLANLARITVE
ncbi:MAG: MarR family transcriptional regulator [Silvibacterium sp.]|nr:MarR family transcriptional regulator [Silvibacterium sp.]